MHFFSNAGLNGLKSPAQRSGQFSELGSAQLSSKILGSCWTLGQKLRGNYFKQTAGELKNIIVLSKREGHFALRANQDPNFPAFTILHSACDV